MIRRALLVGFASLLPTTAFASPSMSVGGFDVMSLLPIVLIFGVFYFLLLRPQQKKMKAHQELLGSLHKGDKVITTGGIIGVVQKTMETEVVLEIADGVRVNVVKAMISDVVGKDIKSASDNVTVIPKSSAAPKKTTTKKTK